MISGAVWGVKGGNSSPPMYGLSPRMSSRQRMLPLGGSGGGFSRSPSTFPGGAGGGNASPLIAHCSLALKAWRAVKLGEGRHKTQFELRMYHPEADTSPHAKPCHKRRSFESFTNALIPGIPRCTPCIPAPKAPMRWRTTLSIGTNYP